MILKNGEDLKTEGFCYHYQCKRDFNRAVHNVKRSKKRQQDSKEIGNEVLPSRKLRSAMETFDRNQCLFISSSNINEVIKDNFRLFFTKRFYTQKKHKKHKMQTSDFHSDIFIRLKSIKSKQATFTHKKYKTSNKRLSLRYFYMPEKYKKQTSDFHS